MINKHMFFLLINVFVFSYAQTIKIEGKQLVIGMEKSEALNIMHEFLEHSDHDSLSDNFFPILHILSSIITSILLFLNNS